MNKKRNILAILISPVIGEIFFLILFFINKLIDIYFPKEMDGPMIGDGILYYFFFPVLFIGALIFQIIILEPIFRKFKNKNELNKSLIKKICLIIIFSFSLIFALLFGTIQFGITDYLIALLIGLAIWSSYFIPNMISYYLIYIRHSEMNKKD
jgi:SNF family Na+-dependent transporter